MTVDICLLLIAACQSHDLVRVRTTHRKTYCGRVDALIVQADGDGINGRLLLVAPAVAQHTVALPELHSAVILGSRYQDSRGGSDGRDAD